MKHRIPIVTHRALPGPHARGPAGAGLKIWTVASGPAAESIGPADMNWQSSGPCAPTSRPIRLALPLAQQSISTIHYFHPNPIKSLPKLRGTPTSSPKAYSPSPVITGIVQSSPAANMDAACGSLQDTELRLGLPGTDPSFKLNKRAFTADSSHLNRPSSKAQVVGWPPVRSNRRNSFQGKRSEAAAAAEEIAGVGILVKVSMDGAPYLRKIDLKLYKGYRELRDALEDMFKCFSFSSESELSDVEAYSGTEYAIAYEDKDGDWMLAGDVPWEMFISSCKRLRIMKGSEAKGLASSSSSSSA